MVYVCLLVFTLNKLILHCALFALIFLDSNVVGADWISVSVSKIFLECSVQQCNVYYLHQGRYVLALFVMINCIMTNKS